MGITFYHTPPQGKEREMGNNTKLAICLFLMWLFTLSLFGIALGCFHVERYAIAMFASAGGGFGVGLYLAALYEWIALTD